MGIATLEACVQRTMICWATRNRVRRSFALMEGNFPIHESEHDFEIDASFTNTSTPGGVAQSLAPRIFSISSTEELVSVLANSPTIRLLVSP